MKGSTNLQVKNLRDYIPYAWQVDSCKLDFLLSEETTYVTSHLILSSVSNANEDLVLDGEELALISIKLDNQTLSSSDYKYTDNSLIIPSKFIVNKNKLELEIKVAIYPSKNKALEGLYQSSSILCTQCEAEGFRRITFYPDRPDVMSKFIVRLQGDKQKYPLLLSNGNLIEKGDLGTEHYAIWQDPFKKPCYLFALVAGDLETLTDKFTTISGKSVTINIHSEKHNIDKCHYAMQSIKKSMQWDEQKYGREYDLDIFQIVAVDDFNSGAMENKGLNIFNSECLLASKDTTIDADYEVIEAIIAHEYFHNWSGNRVTLRDWFQLSLKEGFTVFRDSQFTSDNRSSAIKRINDAWVIRTAQFAEDDSTISHPVRPSSYTEIRNFYTLTVYEKGAEVIGMLVSLLGWDTFRKGSDIYFNSYDGQAVRVEEFILAMEQASGRSLNQFMHWYNQAGTPEISISDMYDEKTTTYKMVIKQSQKPTKEQPNKLPMLIPLKIALLDNKGELLGLDANGKKEQLLEIDKETNEFSWSIPQKPTPSLLRNFSAPVKVNYDYSDEQLGLILDKDTDSYNRWDAGQRIKTKLANILIEHVKENNSFEQLPDDAYRYLNLIKGIFENLIHSLANNNTDSETRAITFELLSLPERSWLNNQQDIIFVKAINNTVCFLNEYIAKELQEQWLDIYQKHKITDKYTTDFYQTSMRQIKNRALSYLVEAGDTGIELAWQQFNEADNMTDRLLSLKLLVSKKDSPYGERGLEQLYKKWSNEPLVVNQWLEVQSSIVREDTLDRVNNLLNHSAFDIHNPNKIRSLIGCYVNRSYIGFHRKDGKGYSWFTKKLLEIDSFNPQVAARLATPYSRWKQYEHCLAEQMKQQLVELQSKNISRDLSEVVEKSL